MEHLQTNQQADEDTTLSDTEVMGALEDERQGNDFWVGRL